jgi:hypothetical protein
VQLDSTGVEPDSLALRHSVESVLANETCASSHGSDGSGTQTDVAIVDFGESVNRSKKLESLCF